MTLRRMIASRPSRLLPRFARHGLAATLAATLLSTSPIAASATELPASTSPRDAAALVLVILNVRSSRGLIRAAVYSDEEAYEEESDRLAVATGSSQALRGSVVMRFDGLSPRDWYAIKLFHDENANDAFDMSAFGSPQEGYGFSNGQEADYFGSPDFEDAAFALEADDVTVHHVELTY